MSGECTAVRELIPEFAAGALAGDERAGVLLHVSACAACRGELDAVTAVVDELLALAPEQEPPPGFEAAVLSAITVPPAERRGRRRVALLVATLALVAGSLAGGAGVWQATSADRQLAAGYRDTLEAAQGRYLTAAPLLYGGNRVGQVFGYEGSPSWVFVTATGAPSGSYACTIVTRTGMEIDLGWLEVNDGQGSWGAAIGGSLEEISSMRLRGPGSSELVATFQTRPAQPYPR